MKFYHKIHFKITSGVVLIVLFLLVGLGYSILIDQKRQIMNSLRSNGKQVMSIIAKNSVDAIRFYNYLYLEELCITVEQSHGIAFCEVYDTQENSLIQKSTIGTTTLKKERKPGIDILILDFPILDSDKNHLGKVELGLYLNDLQQELKNTTVKLSAVFTIVILLVALCLNIFLSRFFITPVLNISNMAALLARKKFVNVNIKPRQDEIGDLIKNFDIMSNNLRQSFARIEKQNQKLMQSENKFYQVFKLSPNAFSITRISDGALLEINRGFTEIFGYSNQDVTDKRSIEFNIWPSESEKKRVIDKLITEGKLKNEETRYKTKDGKIFDAYVSSVIIEINNEPVILAEVMDITHHKKAEEQLNFSNMRYETLFQNSPIPLWEEDFSNVYQYFDDLRSKGIHDFREYAETNPSFFKKCIQKIKILNINQAGLKLHGAKTKEELLKNLNDLFTEKSYEVFKEELLALSDGFFEFESEDEVKTLSGETKAIFLKMTIDKGHHGSFRALVATVDITDRKQMEEQLMQAQKMESIGNLAGGIAHDFNNILSGIYGYIQLTTVHKHNPEKIQKYMDQLMNSAQRAADLVQQILTFSRKAEYQKKPLKIYHEITESLKLLRASIPTTIEFKKELKSKSMVSADPTKIHQVIMNLCTNAYHAMRTTGGVLTLSLTDIKITEPKIIQEKRVVPGDYIQLIVSDTGHGMDNETLKKVTEPYFTTKGTGQGTGLGLALVSAIVDEHDGFLYIHSQVNKGSSFFICLPTIPEKHIKTPPISRPDQPVSGKEKIMVVDDEESIRDILKTFLESHGYKVSVFPNGLDALKSFKSDPAQYDLIITDMTMPELSGDKLIKAVLEIKPDLPVLLCTGYSENLTKDKIIELGVKKLFQKPLENTELIYEIRKILDEQTT